MTTIGIALYEAQLYSGLYHLRKRCTNVQYKKYKYRCQHKLQIYYKIIG